MTSLSWGSAFCWEDKVLRSELSTGSTAELPETAETVLLAILLVATGALEMHWHLHS